jgi:hypothetical protein
MFGQRGLFVGEKVEVKTNLSILVRNYIKNYRKDANDELDWFKKQPSLEAAIKCAALATKEDKRFSHQRRLAKDALKEAESRLQRSSAAIGQCETFDELHDFITMTLDDISGLGELYFYDTALRIGAFLNFYPDKVYLHRGTRHGAQQLANFGLLTLPQKTHVLTMDSLPDALKELEPHEVEDLLCIYKEKIRAT